MAELAGVCGAYDLEGIAAALSIIKGSNKGYLSVCDATRDVCFVFAQGGLRMATRGVELPALSDWILTQGDLSPSEQERFRGQPQDGSEESEREALLRSGVSEGRLERAARSLMGRTVLDALFWDAPQFDANLGEAPFRDGMLGDGIRLLRVGSGLQPLVEGLLSRLKSLQQTMEALSTTRVAVLTTSESKARDRREESGDSLEGRVLDLVLGKPGIHGSELLERLTCGETALVSVLAALCQLGVLKTDPLPDDPSRRAEAEARIGRTLALLPRRLWLSRAARSAGDRPAAALHESRAGWLLVDQNRSREALEHFGEALSQSPDELEAMHGRVHVLWNLERAEEAATETQALGRLLLDTGLPNHALEALRRANAVRDRVPLEVLEVEALVALGDRSAARELSSHVTAKLRSKGRETEAQRVEAMVGRQAQSHAPVLLGASRRASGALKASASLSVVAAVALSAAAWFGWQDLLERRAYAGSVEQARTFLAGEVDLDALEPLFPEYRVSGSPAGRATADVRAELELLRQDEETVRELREVVKIAWAEDLERAIRFLDFASADAKTRALKVPIRALREEAETHLEQARHLQRRLEPLATAARVDEAFKLGKRLERDYANVPSVVDDFRTKIPIRIVSEPPRAIVGWEGLEVGATPMVVKVSLRGEHKLKLERRGYVTVEREVRFADLDGPELVVTLEEQAQ